MTGCCNTARPRSNGVGSEVPKGDITDIVKYLLCPLPSSVTPCFQGEQSMIVDLALRVRVIVGKLCFAVRPNNLFGRLLNVA